MGRDIYTMGLFYKITDEEVTTIARKVYNKHFELVPKLNTEYDDRKKSLMYDDILYNLGYLNIAIEFGDEKVFKNYAIWLYQLLCNLMKDLDRKRVRDQMVLHYKIMKDVLSETLSDAEYQRANHYLDNAIEATEKEFIKSSVSSKFESGKYVDIKKEYLSLLIRNETQNAIKLIKSSAQRGIKLEDIYLEILQEVMYEVGNLWHQNVITIDKEHYCTATTQAILSQFYPAIFSKPRKGYKIVTCCVGSELHEMGVRMLSDIFEYHGWDSFYLGAAVSTERILDAIKENSPDLVALSVTMPHHLSLCNEVVNEIRAKYKDIKIAVGGRAFQTTDQLWKKWDVDISTDDALQLVEWATNHITKKVNND